MTRRYIILLSILAALCFTLAAIVGGLVYISQSDDPVITIDTGDDLEFKQFDSVEEYNQYLQSAQNNNYYLGGLGSAGEFEVAASPDMQIDDLMGSAGIGDGGDVDQNRVSETYVQVAGVDEADIVKTDGESIFLSNLNYYYYTDPIILDDVLFEETLQTDRFYPEVVNTTKVISAFPPSDLKLSSEINSVGKLLLDDDVLVVVEDTEINAYDVRNVNDPEKIWDLALGVDSYVDVARMYNNELYLFASTYVYSSDYPCPVPLLEGGDAELTIACTDIYHPTVPAEVDKTFTVLKINPGTGDILDDVSFVGSSYASTVYMSGENIYVSYQRYTDQNEIIIDFLVNETSDIFPREIRKEINKINGYDISSYSKFYELSIVLENYYSGLDEEARMEVEDKAEARLTEYMVDKVRELQNTDIVRIDSDSLAIKALGSVPGYTLNQFSFDEYDGYLRVATSITDTIRYQYDTNDLYVLDSSLDIVGAVKDFGLDESIYGVRFMGDLAYVVTFKQIDPFYVIDLTNPTKPEIAGELKIPGYSSFLHQINEELVLGIGREDFGVKAALYDVSDVNNPRELDKLIIDGDWTELEYNHNAFLIDAENEIFFIPGSNSAYIVSYDDENLALVKEIDNLNAQRAIYINDYLYVIGNDKLVVLDETDWSKVSELAIN
ncbi:beta-propeller domain-containing protein [Candidatus Dojkabacteria bacterium]|uniref:Beta-propeller domain-containing protein n=1 Tax=Candidatus Dojkabacteria bacterium TaxID=2099670 RepID=A0A955RID5_9BACT|nr:beta-propeller domain-containing protein [Candidatus Dojkabacteria bacterium]